jgi:hypothetical protein
MVSSIHQTGYGLQESFGTYETNTLYKLRVCFGFGQNQTCNYTIWCNSLDITPSYYTNIYEEGSGRVFRNTNTEGAPTLPVTVISEINGSSVTQNLAPSALKEPVILYFKLKEGYELPSWLTFEEGSGRIYGQPPQSASSFPTIQFTEENKIIEMYLRDFGESNTEPFDKEKATLRGYALGTIQSAVADNTCPT